MSMEYQKILLEDKQGWIDALAGVPHSFFHTWDCVHAIAQFHEIAAHLHVMKFEDAFLLVPVLERSYKGHADLVSPYGYSGLLSSQISILILFKIIIRYTY